MSIENMEPKRIVLAALMTPLVLALSMFVLCMLFSLVRWSLTVDDMTHAILPLCLITLVLGYAVILPFGLPLLLFINHKLGVVNKRTIGKVAVLSGGLGGCLVSFAVWGFPIPAWWLVFCGSMVGLLGGGAFSLLLKHLPKTHIAPSTHT